MNKISRIRLGVNIDHVATLRNARGTFYPDPLKMVKLLEKLDVDGVTVHLREDRRHIIDSDVKRITNESHLPVNLEMAATEEMQKIATELIPNAVCLVPEKREERTNQMKNREERRETLEETRDKGEEREDKGGAKKRRGKRDSKKEKRRETKRREKKDKNTTKT